MKKIQITMMTVLAVLVMSIGNTIQSQTNEWELVFSESEEFIRDLCFVPGDDGLWQTGWGITGYPESNIIKTTDGGDTWIEIEQSFSTLLAGISFANEDTGYICTLGGGETNPEGFILKSTDGGLTWFEIHGSEDDSFDKIKFKDADNGVVAGYPSYYTTNGGATWNESTLPGEWDVYWQFDYAANNTYFGIQLGGDIGKTTDGGQTWTDIHSVSPTMLGGVSFYDENHGIIGGDLSQIVITHDGGDTWETETLGDGEHFGKAVGAFDADIMYAAMSSEEIWVTADGGESWVMDTILEDYTFREMVVTGANVVYLCGAQIGGGGTVWRKVGELPLTAAFNASETIICAGTTVDYTDQSYYDVVSWSWTFEGGSPSVSEDQNPSVTYDEGGIYNVTLTVTNSDGDSETITETAYIEVAEVPVQAETPAGEEDICTSQYYTYTIPEIEYAEYYEWELLPEEAGELTTNENEAGLSPYDDWTGEFTLRVRAGNYCDDGEWSEYLNVNVYLSPELFSLSGGGSFCEGEEGVEITLDGSQTGIFYQLILDGEAIGDNVPGTGDELSFGLQTNAGIYEASGSNENCEIYMYEQIEVVVLENPSPEVNGPEMVCDEEVANYETENNDGNTYFWEVTGGMITEGQGTAMVTIQWGDAGDGSISVTEENENGCVNTTIPFEVLIDDCTLIGENGNGSMIKIYPNPANDQLNVSAYSPNNTTYTIQMYNHIGQQVAKYSTQLATGQNTYQINISQLNQGLYLIVIENDKRVIYNNRFLKN